LGSSDPSGSNGSATKDGLAGRVGEFAGAADGELWRRYVAILLDGMRQRIDQQLDAVLQTWNAAGRR
jgi:hypothetical protein